ncbi:MAG TPA: hypothetical protein VLB76_10510 [Thermoanaerobaculia bacterium]|jgi:hypothetical protein|nr:hypothetical protein [Thermoanaerobaculia bacterium]
MPRLLLALSAALSLLCACTPHAQLRGTGPSERLIDLKALAGSRPGDPIREEVARRSIERYEGFTLGFIELSDDGHVKDEIQKEQVFEMVREVAAEKGAIVLTFVHGWHHSASVCDSNVACFRSVLQGISQDPDRLNKGPVIGIYLGWRGDSSRKLQGATFYNRKRAAHRIGENGGSRVLLDLANLTYEINTDLDQKRSPGFVTMVTAGHSFGGALVFSAVDKALAGEWSGRDGVGPLADGAGIKAKRHELGDLVLLINPAFEADRYRLFDSDLALPGRYAPQCPVLVTVASEGDAAVGTAFPIGRFLWLLWHPLRWGHFGAELTGAGHYVPQQTHELRYDGPVEVEEEKPGTCGCPFPSPAEMRNLRLKFAESRKAVPSSPAEPCAALRAMDANGFKGVLPDGIRLTETRPNWDKSSPYLVLRASASLIPGHNEIYNKNFVKFLSAYLNLYLQEKPDDTP